MKYSHRSNYRKTCPHDPDSRTQLGQRLHYARLKLGWSIEAAGKYFQVTDRTWHNWENGLHRIPFAVYKLARVLARLELPGEAWAGWRLEGSALITPEGRQIRPQDGTWWSLLVRRAAGFDAAYNEAATLRKLLIQVKGTVSDTASASGEAAALPGPDAVGLVPYKTTLDSTTIQTSNQHQNDVIIESWPILCDSPTPLTPLHAPRPITSASALTPSSVLPWTPTCGIQLTHQRPPVSPHRLSKIHLKQLLPVQSPPSSPAPKSRPAMKKRRLSDKHCSSPDSQSARAAAAQAAEQPSTPRGAP